MGTALTTDHPCWFAARTRCGAELGVRDRLDRLGTEHFLPLELLRRSRSRTTYEHPLIPGLIFLRATKKQACALTNEMSLPVRYLIDPATHSLLVVPDKQLDDFRRVLDLSAEEGGLLAPVTWRFCACHQRDAARCGRTCTGISWGILCGGGIAGLVCPCQRSAGLARKNRASQPTFCNFFGLKLV